MSIFNTPELAPPPAPPPAPDTRPTRGLSDIAALRARRLRMGGTREVMIIDPAVSLGAMPATSQSTAAVGSGLSIPR